MYKFDFVYRGLALVITIILMRIIEILFQTPWTAIEAISVVFWVWLLINYFLHKFDDLERSETNDLD